MQETEGSERADSMTMHYQDKMVTQHRVIRKRDSYIRQWRATVPERHKWHSGMSVTSKVLVI